MNNNFENSSREELLEEIQNLKRVLKSKNRLGLVWEDKSEQLVNDCRNNAPIVIEDKSKRLFFDNQKPNNIIIEGDNYHSLSVLNYTHAGKIDIIYIDPPYNTGARDWCYNNNYVDENDSYRHSKWLSMMDSRLRLAKNLLKPEGVLIVTIDKNEQAHLGTLLGEIYSGYESHCITIIHNPRGVQGKNFSYTNEYAFFLFKEGLRVIKPIRREETLKEEFKDHGGSSKREDAKNCFYPILVQGNEIIGFGDVVRDMSFHPAKNIKRSDGVIEVYPIDAKGVERKWIFARDTVETIKDNLYVELKRSGNLVDIWRIKDKQKPKTVWSNKLYDASVHGTKLLNSIIPDNKFDFPKSLYAVKDCLDIVITNGKAIILDFFAGSGTTGHAVMELNKEDGGNRKFILCTNNENKIAEEVTYPRIKNIIRGYEFKGKEKTILMEENLNMALCKNLVDQVRNLKQENSQYDSFESDFSDSKFKLLGVKNISSKKEGIPANLCYLKTQLIPLEKLDAASDDQKTVFSHKAGYILAFKEDALLEIESNDHYQIFHNGRDKYVGVYFKENLDHLEELEEKILNKKLVKLYIFSYTDNNLYANDYQHYPNVILENIPESILKIYRKLNY